MKIPSRLEVGLWPLPIGIDGAGGPLGTRAVGKDIPMRLCDFLWLNPCTGGFCGGAVTTGEDIISPQSSMKSFDEVCIIVVDGFGGAGWTACGFSSHLLRLLGRDCAGAARAKAPRVGGICVEGGGFCEVSKGFTSGFFGFRIGGEATDCGLELQPKLATGCWVLCLASSDVLEAFVELRRLCLDGERL